MRRLIFSIALTAICTCAKTALAGGSGLNVVVVVNQSSVNSVELGNYFCERRHVSPQNVLRINWTNGIRSWTRTEFDSTLSTPIQTMLATRQLTNQIEFVALSMDIPYIVTESNGLNSTTSALFYGFKADTTLAGFPDSCSLPDASSNSFAGSESIFRTVFPGQTNFLATMLTASNLALAKQLVDQGVNSDGMFSTQTVVLAKTSDGARNVRYQLFEDAILNTRLRGNYSTVRTDSDSPLGQTNLLGYQTGLAQFNVSPNAFVPGSMADNLTSYGGDLFNVANVQTTLLAFTHAGTAGSYGTVVEPCNYIEKFPSPQNYFYQSRGFALAECYYQSLTNPYQGLIVGEPLAAPFAHAATGTWDNLPDNSLLAGTTNLSMQYNSPDTQHPIQQVDLFLDGIIFKTLTNVSPISGNRLSVTIAGHSTNFAAAPFATIKSVTSNLTVALNTPSFTNAAKIVAFNHGDRIELQSLNTNLPGSQISVTVSNDHVGLGGGVQTFIAASRTNFLDAIDSNLRPRNHLYITVGTTNLPLTFSLNTTTLADGYHELTAVAYEGSHVRTQTRITRNVRIQNSLLTATFTPLFGGTNFAVEGIMQFSVTANTNNISKIELFSTGGLLTATTNEASPTFDVAATTLGVGLHPFYAIVTDTNGKTYRTETRFIRLVPIDTAFAVYVSRLPLTITWSSVAGRGYDVLSATNLADVLQFRTAIAATNVTTQWIEPQPDSLQRFYRIRVSQ